MFGFSAREQYINIDGMNFKKSILDNLVKKINNINNKTYENNILDYEIIIREFNLFVNSLSNKLIDDLNNKKINYFFGEYFKLNKNFNSQEVFDICCIDLKNPKSFSNKFNENIVFDISSFRLDPNNHFFVVYPSKHNYHRNTFLTKQIEKNEEIKENEELEENEKYEENEELDLDMINEIKHQIMNLVNLHLEKNLNLKFFNNNSYNISNNDWIDFSSSNQSENIFLDKKLNSENLKRNGLDLDKLSKILSNITGQELIFSIRSSSKCYNNNKINDCQLYNLKNYQWFDKPKFSHQICLDIPSIKKFNQLSHLRPINDLSLKILMNDL